MKINVERLGDDFSPASGGRLQRQPKEIRKLAEQIKAEYDKKADAIEAHAETLQDPEAKNKKLIEAAEVRYQGEVGVYQIVAEEGLEELYDDLWDDADSVASNAFPAVKDATLWVIGFGHGTKRPREAWVRDIPWDGKVHMNVIWTASGHDGPEKFEEFSNTNTYVAEVWWEKPNGQRELITKTEYTIKDPPEHASMSDEIELDLAKYKGKIIVVGWPKGSAGVSGYREERETIIHNP